MQYYERTTTKQIAITTEMMDNAQQKNKLLQQQTWDNLKKDNPKDYLLRKFRNDYLGMLKQRLLKQSPFFKKDDKLYEHAK